MVDSASYSCPTCCNCCRMFHPCSPFCNQLRTCMPMPSVRLIFSLLVLSNVASKLLRTNLPLNKAKPSKNSNVHLLFPDSMNSAQRRGGAGEGKTKVFSAFAPLRLCVYFFLSNFELLSDARIQHRALL